MTLALTTPPCFCFVCRWQAHLIRPIQYRKFCQENFGHVLDRDLEATPHTADHTETAKVALLACSCSFYSFFDFDGNGRLDFRELLVCLTMLHTNSAAARVKLIFQVFDVDGDGFLCREGNC